MTQLAHERYISIESFKRDGGGVKTPVWCAPQDGKIVVVTAADSFKVKRLRRNPKLRAAKCDVRGKLLGPWHEGTCSIVEARDEKERAYVALRKKYGVQMRLLDLFSRLGGKYEKRVVLEITLAE